MQNICLKFCQTFFSLCVRSNNEIFILTFIKDVILSSCRRTFWMVLFYTFISVLLRKFYDIIAFSHILWETFFVCLLYNNTYNAEYVFVLINANGASISKKLLRGAFMNMRIHNILVRMNKLSWHLITMLRKLLSWLYNTSLHNNAYF